MTSTVNDHSAIGRWRRFIVGLLLLAGLVSFLASGYAPPGVCGEVLRHNQEAKIDASPFFYGDVANMAEIERDFQLTRNAARLRAAEENRTGDTVAVHP